MAVSNGAVFGQFHPNCGEFVTLSLDRRTANCVRRSGSCIAVSNDPIPNGLKFSVKVLQQSPFYAFHIGVTSKSPDSGPVPGKWSDISISDQHWCCVRIRWSMCAAYHKGQERHFQWALASSQGNTFGVAVSETGELHLYHNGRDVGAAWEGLLTDKPLWGFVCLPGCKVEANYIIAKEHAPAGHPQPLDQHVVTPAPTGHPQDYAGQTYHFVERPPDGLTCAVCQALAHDPVQANCCGNIYCARCIERWKGRSNSCPTCRSTEQSKRPFTVFEDRRAYRDVRCLSVHCPNQSDGCKKNMELSEVDNHLTSDSGCPVQVVDCGNKCGHKERRAGVKKHMTSECRLRREKCQYCPLVSTHEQVTGAHLKECPNFPLDCPNKCDAQGLTRSTVLAHREVCPLQQVECEFERLGCIAILLRKDIAKHLQTSVQDHLQHTKRRLEQMEDRAEEQEIQLKEERAERQLMETRLKEVEATLARVLARMN